MTDRPRPSRVLVVVDAGLPVGVSAARILADLGRAEDVVAVVVTAPPSDAATAFTAAEHVRGTDPTLVHAELVLASLSDRLVRSGFDVVDGVTVPDRTRALATTLSAMGPRDRVIAVLDRPGLRSAARRRARRLAAGIRRAAPSRHALLHDPRPRVPAQPHHVRSSRHARTPAPRSDRIATPPPAWVQSDL